MRNRGALYLGILLLAFGGFFLFVETATELFSFLGFHFGWAAAWPLIIILVGLAFWLPIFVWWERREHLGGLAIPATIITANGLILLYQNISGDWGSWAYAWALEPLAVGMGLLVFYLLGNRAQGLLVGAGIVSGIGLLFFVIFASAFGGLFRLLGPVALILMGILIIYGGAKQRATHKIPEE
jgi:hypothetical protein